MLAGQMKQVSGGVGRNVADALGRFGHNVRFISAIGDDSNGHSILKSLNHIVNYTRPLFFFYSRTLNKRQLFYFIYILL